MKVTEIVLANSSPFYFQGKQLGTVERGALADRADSLRVRIDGSFFFELPGGLDISEQLRAPRVFLIEGNPDTRFFVFGVQVRVLAQILERQDVRRQIAQIATECGSMPDALVDGINDVAMDLVGDVIIDTHCEPPAIEEEDRLMVQQILTLEWSNAANQSS